MLTKHYLRDWDLPGKLIGNLGIQIMTGKQRNQNQPSSSKNGRHGDDEENEFGGQGDDEVGGEVPCRRAEAPLRPLAHLCFPLYDPQRQEAERAEHEEPPCRSGKRSNAQSSHENRARV